MTEPEQPGESPSPRRTPQEPETLLAFSRLQQGEMEYLNPLREKIFKRLRELHRKLKAPAGFDEGDLYFSVAQQVERTLDGKEFTSREKFWAWIERMARNAVIDAGRRYQREKKLIRFFGSRDDTEGDTQDLSPLDRAGGNDPTPSATYRAKELQSGIDECIEGIGGEAARVLRLYQMQLAGGGKPDYREIVRQLGLKDSKRNRDHCRLVRFRAAEELLHRMFRRYGDDPAMRELLRRFT